MPKCPNCSGLLYPENDMYENYLLCIMCSREYNLDMTSKRMTPAELEKKTGIVSRGDE